MTTLRGVGAPSNRDLGGLDCPAHGGGSVYLLLDPFYNGAQLYPSIGRLHSNYTLFPVLSLNFGARSLEAGPGYNTKRRVDLPLLRFFGRMVSLLVL